jgi:uncharacterized protein (TIGR02246 family)
MKKLFMVLPLVFLLCFTFSCEYGQEAAEEPVVDVEADVQTIKALFANNSSVINSGDLEGWVDQFTEDAIFMPPNSAGLRGKEAGREFARPWYEQLNMEFDLTVNEIEVHGDWAFARWSYSGRYTPKAGGETIQDFGKEIWILKRQSDSSWKCSHIIWNNNSSPDISPEKEPTKEAKEVRKDMNDEADIEAINEIWNQYILGANTSDLELWLSLWDENGIRMAPDDPAAFGKEQIRAQMEPLFGQFNTEIAINNEEVQIAGDWAFSRGAFILSLTPKVGGETTKFEGKYLSILERQADGSWKIARDCFNYNAPPTTEKE